MKRFKLGTLSSLTLLAAIITCGSFSDIAAQTNQSGKKDLPLVGTQWKVVDLNGRPVPEEGVEYFALQEGAESTHGLVGRLASPTSDGCNDLTGQYENQGDILRIRFTTSTLMACAVPRVRVGWDSTASPVTPMNEPQRFVQALRQTSRFSIHESTLELLNSKGLIVARLTANQD